MASESFLPKGLRWAGPALAAGYGLGVRIHRAISKPKWAPIPTICIGNMTVGGTGKTPAAVYVAKMLARMGRRPAILMRGDKAQGGDEAGEVKAALRDLNVPVILGSDRYTSALEALKRGCDVALLDDGFQHWRLARDLDIVLVDATDPFGGGALLPLGRLREPREGLSRAGMILVTRADRLSAAALEKLKSEISLFARDVPILLSRHLPSNVRELHSESSAWTLDGLKNLDVVGACGIGNPDAFHATLSNACVRVAEFVAFGDHHDFSTNDIQNLSGRARASNAAAICVTEKDAVKIEKLPRVDGVRFLALRVELSLDAPEILEARIEAALKSADTRCAANRS